MPTCAHTFQLLLQKYANVTDKPLNDNNEILIKREPLVYTTAQRTVQKTKKYHLG